MDAWKSYRTSAVTTAGPAQLVLMLFDGALGALDVVRRAFEDGGDDPATTSRELQRVQDIVTELTVSLDFERGQPVAGNLAAIYEYCQRQLIQATIDRDPALIGEVATHLRPLRDAWDQACVASVPAPVAERVG